MEDSPGWRVGGGLAPARDPRVGPGAALAKHSAELSLHLVHSAHGCRLEVQRPQSRGSNELAATQYEDGSGSHCYEQQANAEKNDRSYRSWTCAEY